MKYTIIFTRTSTFGNGRISWLDPNEFDAEEKANTHAAKMCHEWWDTDPTISYMILKHQFSWKEEK